MLIFQDTTLYLIMVYKNILLLLYNTIVFGANNYILPLLTSAFRLVSGIAA